MSRQPTLPPIMTTQEVAARLGCSIATVRRAIRQNDGSIPGGHVVGSTYLIYRAVFERCVTDGIEPQTRKHRSPLIVSLADRRAS